MAVLILTLITSLFIGGALWFVLGSRIKLSEDDEQNQLLNLIAYMSGALPIAFVLIFFGLGG